MKPNNPKTPYWPAVKATAISYFWKVLIVAAGVGAYYGLNSMEKTKGRYEQAKSAPVVIVDRLNNSEANSRNSIELSTENLKKMFEGYADRIKKEERPSQTELDTFVSDMKGYVDRVKYQSFGNGNALVLRLNEEILKDQLSDERVTQQQSDILAKEYATKRYALQTKKNENCPDDSVALQAPPSEDLKFSHVRRRRAARQQPVVDCEEIAKQLKAAENNYKAQAGGIKDELGNLTRRTEQRVKSVQEDFKPRLLAALAEVNNKQPVNSFAYLFPATVLDQKNGSHVIYNIFWLTCMVVLVFGVLFVILLLLRPLPPFAGGTEALTEQAKSFLSKRGASATPELARTVIVTTAALGVGTAVAVAGGMNMGGSRDRSFHLDPDSVQSYYLAMNNDRRWEKPEVGPSPQIVVNAPVSYPSPMTINIPSSDGPRIAALENAIKSFDSSLNGVKGGVTGLDDKVMQMNNGYIGDLSRINEAVAQLETRETSSSSRLNTAETNLAILQGQADVLRGDIMLRLGIAGDAMEGIRRDNVARLPNGNRSFFSRVRSIFDFGGARYMVTNQSYMAIESALCTVIYSPGSKKLDLDRTRVVEECDLTAPCVRTPICADETLQQILPLLKALIGLPPMTESELMDKLKDVAKAAKWKPVILRYTRVSN